jgi:hypothetical protein
MWKSTDVSEEHMASTFRFDITSSFSHIPCDLLLLLFFNPEDWGCILIRNVCWLSPDYTILYPRTPEDRNLLYYRCEKLRFYRLLLIEKCAYSKSLHIQSLHSIITVFNATFSTSVFTLLQHVSASYSDTPVSCPELCSWPIIIGQRKCLLYANTNKVILIFFLC